MSPAPLKNGAGGILHVGLSICECVYESVRTKNLVITISQTTNEWNFAQFWSQMYLGL